MKICKVEAELFHIDGWIDRQADGHDKANSCFLQFADI